MVLIESDWRPISRWKRNFWQISDPLPFEDDNGKRPSNSRSADWKSTNVEAENGSIWKFGGNIPVDSGR